MHFELHYRSGEVIRVGDRVRLAGGWIGVVVEIFLPGTPLADQFLQPRGGIIVEGEKGGNFVLGPGDYDWDDLELLERGQPQMGSQ